MKNSSKNRITGSKTLNTKKHHMKHIFTILVLVGLTSHVSAQQAFYDVTAANGNGIRFWSDNAYKIHMGNTAEYKYGPVTDYSIKMNMNNTAGRGWSWGVGGVAPIAAIGVNGNMQIAGAFTSGTMVSILSGNGKGIRFWDNDAFKIHMGNTAEYQYGPVTDYSIKTSMSNTAGRGWTWGIAGSVPVAALGITGTMQIAGAFITNGLGLARYGTGLAGDANPYTIYTNDNQPHDLTLYGNGATAILHFRLYDGDLKLGGNSVPNTILHNNGNASFAGNVGIGTPNPTEKLTVNGTIYGKEIKVDLLVPGPDYVFEKDYDLPTLTEIKSYIDQHKHLPEVPSAKDMEANGINVGEMNMILLKKVEELTLYMVEANKKIDDLNTALQKLQGSPR
jgi:hypothetical protein